MIALHYLLLKNINKDNKDNKNNIKKDPSIIEPHQKIEYDVVKT